MVVNDFEAREQRRVARQRQEMVETKREIARSLYKYNARTLSHENTVLMTGDYMMFDNESGKGVLVSSRGAAIAISAEELADMVNDGAISKVFNPDDLNAPDFESKIDNVLTQINIQSQFEDASIYKVIPNVDKNEEEKGLAFYVSVQDPQKIDAVVVKSDDKFTMMSYDDFKETDSEADAIQCTYARFNPGAVEMKEQLAKMNGERENKQNAYSKLIEEYTQNGGNYVKEPGEIAQDSNLTAKERLDAVKQATEAQQEQVMQQAQIAENEEDMGYVPKSFQKYT